MKDERQKTKDKRQEAKGERQETKDGTDPPLRLSSFIFHP